MKFSHLKQRVLLIILIVGSLFKPNCLNSQIIPVSFSELQVEGELRTRILKNFSRLEEEKYQPNNVFLTDRQSGDWPGDTEGRTILGLVLDAQSGHCSPKYLEEIINHIPEHLNNKGYMGKIYPSGIIDEQQLAGNSWMLRGLCEYYAWKKDKRVLEIIKSIVNNLYLPIQTDLENYPMDISGRSKKVGGAMGQIEEQIGNWKLSSDIGCIFISLDGLTQAYRYVPSRELQNTIESILNLFLRFDFVQIKAQTHATLTSLRGVLRYAQNSSRTNLVSEVEKRWELYKAYGMTENYANYNFFTRYNVATEPCAIVDSYLLVAQLWMTTNNPEYLKQMDLIYYNALSHGQRANGGFGTDILSSPDSTSIRVNLPEAHWCCTMRGGEGLSKVAEYSYFTQKDTAYIVHYVNSIATLHFSKKSLITIKQKTDYPFSDGVSLTIINAQRAGKLVIKLNSLTQWTENVKVFINGIEQKVKIEKGFILLQSNWKTNDEIKLEYDSKIRIEKPINNDKFSNAYRKVFYGPLLLAYSGVEQIKINDSTQIKKISTGSFKIEGSDIKLGILYHLLNPEVAKGIYKKQFIFSTQ